MLNKTGVSLLGATNYYRNLLFAAASSRRLQPVLMTAGELPPPICDGLPPLEIVTNPFASVAGKLNFVRRAASRVIGRDFLMERLLHRNEIGVFSHSGVLGRSCSVATTPWIPDFQHRRMPEFFSRQELAQRDSYFSRCVRASTLVVLSSESAKQDLAEFMPLHAHKARVLRFTSSAEVANESQVTSLDLAQRYKIREPYFHLPNQFWIHKNHGVVIKALGLARARGAPFSVVATGHLQDRRDPNYFSSLLELIRQSGCEQDIKLLGVVPYADVVGLMQNAMAVINPSHFEGWSTSVEEAKSLGKSVILSSIPVHLEQAPEHGFYFDANDAEQLVEQMLKVRDAYLPEIERLRRADALNNFPGRLSKFQRDYEDIIIEAYETNASRSGKTGK